MMISELPLTKLSRPGSSLKFLSLRTYFPFLRNDQIEISISLKYKVQVVTAIQPRIQFNKFNLFLIFVTIITTCFFNK